MSHEPTPAARIVTRLRRPAQLHLEPVPFVPRLSRARRAAAEARWKALCAENPAYHDGRLCHVLGIHRNGHGGATIHVADCAYRHFAVQDRDLDLGVRPLGVKGIVRRGDEILVGRRPAWVAGHPDRWELVPSGTVEPGEDPAGTVVRELAEETALTTTAPPVAVALLRDDALRCWELVFEMAVPEGTEPRALEYDAFEWCRPPSLPGPLTPVAHAMLDLLVGR